MESRLLSSIFWKQFHRGLPLVGMLWFQRWFEKLLTSVAPSPSSGSFHQLVLCRALRGSGMDKITEINWGEKPTNWTNVTFVSKVSISALGRAITPYSGTGGNFWPLNCWFSAIYTPAFSGKNPKAKVYCDHHNKSWFLDASLNKSCSYA